MFFTPLVAPMDDTINIARNKTAFQSSAYNGATASKAVDGNACIDYYAGYCTHTNNDHQAWWAVDLEAVTKIAAVQITNRGDCCGKSMKKGAIAIYSHTYTD